MIKSNKKTTPMQLSPSGQFQNLLRIPCEQKHRLYIAACILLTSVFAGTLLFLAASNKAVWLDEVYSLAPVKHSWRTIWACAQQDVHPPLFFLMERCWYLLFGDSIFAMKCLSILPMILGMALTAWFLIKECSGKAAVLFLLCCIASENIVHYSIEIRMYSWAFLFVTMTTLCAWFIIKTGKTIWWAGFILCAVAAAYTHYYAATIVAIGYGCLAAYILKYDRKNLLKAGVSAVAAILLYLPWLPSAINSFTGASNDFWILPLTLRDIARYGYAVFMAGNMIATLCFFGLFCFVLYRFLIRKNKTKQEGFAFVGLCCLVMLAVVGIGISIGIRPLFQAKYLFPGFALVWLFFAIAGASIKRKRVFIFMCAGLLAIGMVTLATSVYKERKEHQEFMRFYSYMTESVRKDDVFIFPRQEGHTVGVTAGLFPGHRYAYQFKKIGSISETCWAFLGSTRIEYAALSDIQADGAWLIVSEQDRDGKQSDFVIPPDAQSRWCGRFGWGGYKFNLYRIGFPAALGNSSGW